MNNQKKFFNPFLKQSPRRNLFFFLVTIFTCLLTSLVLVAGNGNLKIDKKQYLPGEQIKVHFTAGTGFAANAWIGIIPSDVPHGSEKENDAHDLTYQHLQGKSTGTLIFSAPGKNGTYDFRMNDNDDNGKEAASVTFQVGELTPSIKLEKTTFKPNEKIRVEFTAGNGFTNNAWIGIIPSDIPHGSEKVNDDNDLAYFHLRGKQKGAFNFLAPKKLGSFDFRLHDNDDNGKEVASITFHVKASEKPSLVLDRFEFVPGEEIIVQFTGAAGFSNDAWVGIVPSQIAHGSEAENDKNDLTYQYLKGKAEGVLTFLAPYKTGSFDLRMNDTDKNGKEVAFVTFKVIQQ